MSHLSPTMTPTLQEDPTMTPLARIIRTVVQVVVACAGLVPLVVALLAEAGITVDGPRLVAIAAAAVALVTAGQNALERTGLIPTLGEPRLREGEPIDAAPLYTWDEVRDLVDRHAELDSLVNLRHALEQDRRTRTGAS